MYLNNGVIMKSDEQMKPRKKLSYEEELELKASKKPRDRKSDKRELNELIYRGI